jgi:flagellar motor switch protein FliN
MATQIEVLKPQEIEDHAAWPMISTLAVKLEANIPVRGFHVRDLLALKSGQTIESAWPVTEDAPLKVGQVQLCWCEFEVVDQRMALRLTRLA